MACHRSAPETVQQSVEGSSERRPTSLKPRLQFPTRPLRLGQAPHLDVEHSRREYTALAAHLGEQLGHAVELVVGQSYDAVVDDLVAGELDMALLTPYPYVIAKERLPALQLLASLLAEGSPRYRGYFVVRGDSALSSVQDIKGTRVAFVDPRSTSGYLFPVLTLKDTGCDVDADLKEKVFAGSHPAVVQRVFDGRVEVGAIASTTFQHLRGEHIQRRLKIIGKTDWMPFGGFVVHPQVSAGVIDKLREILLRLDARTDEGRAVLSGMATINGFVAAEDSDYDAVRRAAGLAVQPE